MPLSRTITNIIDDRSYTTYLFGEQVLQSSWSHPNVPVLVFADSILPGFPVQNHGGPGGSGLGVELLFWGDWWNSPEGSARRILIETRAQTLLNTDYFSELKQYGIERPLWSSDEKRRIAESFAPGTSVSEVAQRYGVNANLLFT
jgi:hypothetical protein